MKKVIDPYDLLASYYRYFSSRRKPYLKAIDDLIINSTKTVPERILDVGAGDGIRGQRIARKLKAREILFLEPSKEMAKKCQKLKAGPVFNINAENLPKRGIKFDIILCLWNVLGHIPSSKNRAEALTRMRARLKNTGNIFIDINNRHNGSSYGWGEIVKRLITDKIKSDETRGDTFYFWEIGKHKIPARGHLFTPFEAEMLFRKVGLKIKKRLAVNYNTGHVTQIPVFGQLFYILEK